MIKAIVDSKDNNKYINNLLLMLRDEEGYAMISDYFGKQLCDPNVDLKVDTLEGLFKYREIREEVLQRYMDQFVNHPSAVYLVSRIIMFKHFGIIKDSPGEYNGYDHKKFLQDYLFFYKNQLSEDEVDLIELYAILEDVKSLKLLMQIDRELSRRDDVVNPLRMKTIDAKVIENYKSEYMDSLITLEQARKMVEDPENKSYRYICKKNGDICYPSHMFCSSDGSSRYQNYIIQEDGTRIIQYQGPNGEVITKKEYKEYNEDLIEIYELKNYALFPKNGGEPYYRDIQITMKNGELYEYFWPFFEGNGKYGLRKQKFYEEERDESGKLEKDWHYAYRVTNTHSVNDGNYWEYKIPSNDLRWEYIVYNSGKQVNKGRLKAASKEHGKIRRENCDYIEQIEECLKNVVQYLELDKNRDNPYYNLVPQYDPNEVEFEEGDVEGFVLYGVNSNQLCISMQRGGVTSEKLAANKLFDGKLNRNMDFTGDVQAKIYIEKYLEGGLSSRSFYYNCTNSNNPNYGIGLGISDIDPNAIIGFANYDAGTSHAIKRLRVSMDKHNRISDILSEQSEASIHAELATLRYEYDITKIRQRNCWR